MTIDNLRRNLSVKMIRKYFNLKTPLMTEVKVQKLKQTKSLQRPVNTRKSLQRDLVAEERSQIIVGVTT